MKRYILAAVAALGAISAMAQSIIVVDSEKVFKSLDSYNSALAEVNDLSTLYQNQVDAKFAAVEQLFNSYAARKAAMSISQRSAMESSILDMEREATEFQELHFSKDGTIMKRRLELIAPIQSEVFGAIERYAESVGADVVLDRSSNPSLLYGSSSVDRTDEVIESLKE